MQAWGFRSLTLDKPALDAGRVAISQASGIFPDGTPFAIPDTMSAPAPVPIKADMAGHVSLAIPIERPGTATIDPPMPKPQARATAA
jgi:type VI secretion system protein ImpJ